MLADDYYIIARLRGDKTEWGADKWYKPEYSWTWTASGIAFPAGDADQNWDDAKWGDFILEIDKTTLSTQDCTLFWPDYHGDIGIGSYSSCGDLYKVVCQLE